MAANQLQHAIDAVKTRRLPLAELRKFLHHPSPVVRANAVEIVTEAIGDNGSLLGEVVEFARKPENSFRLMGTIRVGYFAVLGLLRSPIEAVRQAGTDLLTTWPEADRDDLVYFVQSENE